MKLTDFAAKHHEPTPPDEPYAGAVPVPDLPHGNPSDLTHDMREALVPLHHFLADFKAIGVIVAQGLAKLDRLHDEPYQERLQIGATVFHIKLHGRHYNQLMVGATATMTVFVPGLGTFPRTLNADWNELDYPEGTELSAATPFAAIYQASNFKTTNAV